MKVTTLDTQVQSRSGTRLDIMIMERKSEWAHFTAARMRSQRILPGMWRMTFEGGMLYTISERGEGYIAYKVPGQKLKLRAGMQLVKALFHSMSLKELIRMGQGVSKGGTSL